MNYQTGVPFQGAVPPALRQQGVQQLGAPSPFSFQGSHKDLYAGLAGMNATAFDRDAQAADMEAMQRSRDSQTQMALRGLEQMAQAQDYQRNIAQQIYGNQSGFLGGLLTGLFK